MKQQQQQKTSGETGPTTGSLPNNENDKAQQQKHTTLPDSKPPEATVYSSTRG